MSAVFVILLAVAGICCAVAVALCAPLLVERRRRRVKAADEALARRAARFALSGGDDAGEERPERLAWLSGMLSSAGTRTDPSEWLARTLGIAILAATAAALLLSSAPVAILVAIIALVVPLARLKAAAKGRTKRFEGQLAAALPMVAENLRAGQSPARAMLTVAEYMEDPIREEFSRAAHEMGYGISLPAAMDSMYGRVPCDDLRLLNGVIAINAEGGGDLSDVLDSLAETMQERERMRAHVRSITASGRTSAAIVAALPAFIVVGLWLTSPSYLEPLFTSGPVGYLILLAVAVLDLMGLLVIRSMYRIEID